MHFKQCSLGWKIDTHKTLCSYVLFYSFIKGPVESASSDSFFKANSVNCHMVQIASPWIAHSKTSCVAECKARLQMSCRNVLYNSPSFSCIPVDLHADNPSSFTLGSMYGDVVYTESPTCDTAAGFQLYQTCEASYCLFVSPTTLNYLGAKADCEARNAVIFVSNSLEKYELLETITSGNTWIAMTKNAGTWVWENGDLVSLDFLQTVWGWDQPDNYHDDKCAVHLKSYPSPKTLFDIPCPHYYFNHVCEQNC